MSALVVAMVVVVVVVRERGQQRTQIHANQQDVVPLNVPSAPFRVLPCVSVCVCVGSTQHRFLSFIPFFFSDRVLSFFCLCYLLFISLLPTSIFLPTSHIAFIACMQACKHQEVTSLSTKITFEYSQAAADRQAGKQSKAKQSKAGSLPTFAPFLTQEFLVLL